MKEFPKDTHTLSSIIRHNTGEQRRDRLQSQKVNTERGKRIKKGGLAINIETLINKLDAMELG